MTNSSDMIKDVTEIKQRLINILSEHIGVFKVRVNKPTNFEVNGTVDAPQGKKIVNGIYFSNVVPKEKDCRFYFYPSYTHPEEFEYISDRLKKFRKGKSCFHVKFLDEELESEIKEMVVKAIAVYRKEGWLE